MVKSEFPTKCRDCKRSPKNCICAEYRLTGKEGKLMVVADNIATEPVRGQNTRTWQSRANARRWTSPTYVDGFPVLYLTDTALADKIAAEIEQEAFNPFNYEGQEGCRVPVFDKNILRRFAFLRRARKPIT